MRTPAGVGPANTFAAARCGSTYTIRRDYAVPRLPSRPVVARPSPALAGRGGRAGVPALVSTPTHGKFTRRVSSRDGDTDSRHADATPDTCAATWSSGRVNGSRYDLSYVRYHAPLDVRENENSSEKDTTGTFTPRPEESHVA